MTLYFTEFGDEALSTLVDFFGDVLKNTEDSEMDSIEVDTIETEWSTIKRCVYRE